METEYQGHLISWGKLFVSVQQQLGFLYDKKHELQLLVIQFMVQIISKLDHYYLALLSIK